MLEQSFSFLTFEQKAPDVQGDGNKDGNYYSRQVKFLCKTVN